MFIFLLTKLTSTNMFSKPKKMNKKGYNQDSQRKPQILENSKRIAAKVNKEKNVFNRLHNQALIIKKKLEDKKIMFDDLENKKIEETKLPLNEESRLMASARTKGTFTNYGELLYNEGLKFIEVKEKKIQMHKYQQEKQNDPEATFAPKISKRAQELAQRDGDFFQRIDEMLQQKKNESTIKQEPAKELENFPFQPKINKKSYDLIQEKEMLLRKQNIDRYELLFRDAIKRRLRKEEQQGTLPEDLTFQPRPSLFSSSRHFAKETPAQFIYRLTNTNIEKMKNLEQLRQYYYPDTDPDTGRKLFKPQITPYTMPNGNEASSRPIHEELYRKSDEIQSKKDKMAKMIEEEFKKLGATSKMSEESVRIAAEFKQKKIREIFEFFDWDRDGYIHTDTLDLSVFEDRTLANMIDNVLEGLRQENKHYVSYAEFFVQFEKLLKETAAQYGPQTGFLKSFDLQKLKASIMNKDKPKNNENENPKDKENDSENEVILPAEQKECTFKPKINAKSEQIALQFVEKRLEETKNEINSRVFEVIKIQSQKSLIMPDVQPVNEQDEELNLDPEASNFNNSHGKGQKSLFSKSGSGKDFNLSAGKTSTKRIPHEIIQSDNTVKSLEDGAKIPLHEVLMVEGEKKKIKTEQKLNQKEENELKLCTFHPDIRSSLQSQHLSINHCPPSQMRTNSPITQEKIEKLTQRLNKKKKTPNNQILSSEDIEYSNFCTFHPTIIKKKY